MSVATRRLIIWGLLIAVLAAGIGYAFRPQPVPADLAEAKTGHLLVTIDEEGETRVRDIYTLYAPLRGFLHRIEADAGDSVEAGQTKLVSIEPAPPEFLDVRTEAEQQAAIEAAEAGRRLAMSELDSAEADLAFALSERDRSRRLVSSGTISKRTLDNAERAHRVAEAKLASAKAALNVREFQLKQARSRLLSRQELESRGDDCECIEITAPVSGRVLRVVRRSAGVVSADTPLMEIGDPGNLEVVVDLLSEDAVRINPGDKAIITGWGGPDLNAKVRVIEPFGETKVSALGIEEQRVNVILDLADPPEKWRRLSHGYRVDVKVILFEADVLKLPRGALFRQGEQWAVFVVEDGLARLRPVTLGAENSLEVEIAEGLSEGQQVVLYPSNRIEDGVEVVER
ncbi:efflux RND transporter periplasmic adaptor subunit [Roseibium sp.]|uniref:efflux RND transporter periplasmic adaptor subunit n=1 Tax=Roseibium sp. TaxID=1936156 RepID=UPI003D0AB16F